ncbi:MAG: FAD-binding protein [Rhodococcus sp. (in: high G+C Gram-positive bacteria)]|nr:MAG: FAD-binding protein [Rhodococcus sp. (in: high G+C Gram-positive bacteria)]
MTSPGASDGLDVLIVGGGPAGSATALALAHAGAAVAVVTRPHPRGPRIGETVPPAIIRPLTQLGVWDNFTADGHLAAPGTVVCWGDECPYEYDYIADPYGPSWHLDRARFDSMLIRSARRAGAQVHALGPSGTRIEHDGTCWRIPLAGRNPDVLSAPFLVDATGRAALIARRHGATRRRIDKLIALARFGAAATTEPRTLIEAFRDGWWYATVLPNAQAVTVLFTDTDLLPIGRKQHQSFWETALSHTKLVRDVMPPQTTTPIFTAPAHTAILSRCHGDTWVAVGDAARTLDPLSGQGLMAACESAVRASDAVLAAHRRTALDAYATQTATQHRTHVSSGSAHYQREHRWPSSTFWQRRTETHH